MSVAYAPRIDARTVALAVNLLDLLPPDAKPQRVGRDAYRALCSFHEEKSPAMSVRLTRTGWRFHCFACHESGGAIDYYMRTRQVSFRDALLALAESRPGLDVTTPTKRHVPALVLVCDGPGCLAFSEVEAEDVPFLGITTRTSWHVGSVRSYCWKCAKARTGNGQHGPAPGLRVKSGITNGRYVG